MSADCLLEVNHITVSYGAIRALRDVSIVVRQSESVAILGANGAGKSTLLRTISGLVRPERGTITFDGTNLNSKRPAQIARKGIVHVPEGRLILTRLTVLDNLRLGAIGSGQRDLADRDAQVIYDLFPRLQERKAQLAGTLSGGEQQMLAIGRALAARPRLLMLDEPSMGLSPILVASIFAALRQIQKSVAILLVEQNVRAALSLAERGYLLSSGSLRAEGPAKSLTQDSIEAAYLGRDKPEGPIGGEPDASEV